MVRSLIRLLAVIFIWPGTAVRSTASLALAYVFGDARLEDKLRTWMPGTSPDMTRFSNLPSAIGLFEIMTLRFWTGAAFFIGPHGPGRALMADLPVRTDAARRPALTR